jgi:hypothetical protein
VEAVVVVARTDSDIIGAGIDVATNLVPGAFIMVQDQSEVN